MDETLHLIFVLNPELSNKHKSIHSGFLTSQRAETHILKGTYYAILEKYIVGQCSQPFSYQGPLNQ